MLRAGSPRLCAEELLAATVPVRTWPERRPVLLSAAALVFVATLVAREAFTIDRGVVVSLLFVIPVALIGLELGVRAGVAAAVGTLALVALRPTSSSPTLDALGLATRGTALLAVGVLAGRFSDRMRAVQSQQRQLLRSGLELAHLGKPEMLASAVAAHAHRVAKVAHARVEFTGAEPVELGRRTGAPLRLPISSPQGRFGVLEASAQAGRSLDQEGRLALATLALQAAVAADNHKLLAVERERAALQADLQHTQRRLREQFRSAGHILDVHERERLGIARQLHEQAAQAMAAALLAVGRLERDIVDELTQAQLEKARHSVRECITELRRLAGRMHSPVLAELGLLPALERLFERDRVERSRPIAFTQRALPERLPPDTETLVYRVVEEMLSAVTGALAVRVGLDCDRLRLRIVIEGAALAVEDLASLRASFTTPRARLEMVGGSLESSHGGERIAVTAELPLAPWPDAPVDLAQDALGGTPPLRDALRHAHPSIG